jgi:hypothetical protein
VDCCGVNRVTMMREGSNQPTCRKLNSGRDITPQVSRNRLEKRCGTLWLTLEWQKRKASRPTC